MGSWQLCRSYSRTRHSLCQEGWHAPQGLCRSWQPSNLPHSWSGRDSDFHVWLWGSTPQCLPRLGERGGRVSSMPLCPEEAIHEGISHSGSGGCRSGGSLVGSGAPRGKQLAQGDPCVTPGVQLLPPQPLALPLWRPHPPVRGQVSSGLPVEKQRGCGTRRRVQSFTTLTPKKNRGLHHCTWRAGGEGGVKARWALEVIESHVRIPSEGSV